MPYAQVEAEQSQQRELAQEKEEMTAAFVNLNRLVEDDAEKEADFLKVNHTSCSIRAITYNIRG